MSLAGGCACGAIRYECAGAPLALVTCHCRDCQRAGGSAYAPTVVVSRAELHIVRGQPAVHERAADSGNLARREFCRDCGSPLFASSSARPERVGIRAGSLDHPRSFRPTRAVFTASAQPWDARAKGQ